MAGGGQGDAGACGLDLADKQPTVGVTLKTLDCLLSLLLVDITGDLDGDAVKLTVDGVDHFPVDGKDHQLCCFDHVGDPVDRLRQLTLGGKVTQGGHPG